MNRIPDSDLAHLKQQIPLLELMKAEGLNFSRHGKDMATRCPFHEEKTASLIVTPEENLWHCMGCGKGGSVIDWVMLREGISFFQAYHRLKKNNPAPLAAKRKTMTEKKPRLAITTETQQKAAGWAIEHYHKNLKESPKALDYLAMRGLDDLSIVENFRLGYSSGPLPSSVYDKDLKEIGLIAEGGRSHFYESLIIPVIDEKGHITEIYGRRIDDKTPAHRYLPGPHRGVFNASALIGQEEIILAESLIDGISLWAMGFKNVTASFGTEGFTRDHLEFIKAQGIKKVHIAYDGDKSGISAAKRLQEKLKSNSIRSSIITFPDSMDANSFYLAYPDSKKRLIDLMAEKPSIAEPQPIMAKVDERDIFFQLAGRSYRIRGLSSKGPDHHLKVNILLQVDNLSYIDSVDLYSARSRKSFALMAEDELGFDRGKIMTDLSDLASKVEKIRDDSRTKPDEKSSPLAAKEKAKALERLKDPRLVERIISDFKTSGVVGESTNLLVGYLAAITRKMDRPLAIIIQSSSSAGKSSLMDAVLAMIPKEDRVEYSAMTGQSLFYLGEKDLKHKILAISEEEGAEQASYALKLMQSEGAVTIASTGKGKDGRHETHEYQVEGPIMLFMTTTSVDLDEELVNRCLLLSVNETREQTEAIHRLQREEETLAGLERSARRHGVIGLHHAMQKLLRPVKVINPYAEKLTFQSHKTRTRRDHKKYLAIIRAIAFLHQYQRPHKTHEIGGRKITYIEVAKEDIRLANRLAHEVLGRSLDELPPHTRRLLAEIKSFLKEKSISTGTPPLNQPFTRKEIREFCGLSHEQVRIHLDRLVEMEYVLTHKGKRGQSFVYELLFDGDTEGRSTHLPGLIDPNNIDEISSSKLQVLNPSYRG